MRNIAMLGSGFIGRFYADSIQGYRNRDRIVLAKEPWTVPASLPYGADQLVPMRAGEAMPWRLV